MSQRLSFEDSELTYPQLVAAKGELAAADLIARLRDGRGVVRANALLGLAAIGHTGREVVLFLRDADVRVARAAAEALVQLGAAQREHLSAIAAALAEARAEVVDAVARMFAALIGHADADLISVLDTSSMAAADAMITACQRTHVRGLHLLQAAARDKRTLVRLHAVRGIALLGVIEQSSSFEVLQEVERTDDISDVRAATRSALGALKVRCIAAESTRRKTSDPAPPLVPELEQRVMAPAELKSAAAIAPRDELLRLLDAPVAHARLNAVRVLALKGSAGLETINALVSRMTDVDAQVRVEVATVLGTLGANASVTVAAVPALVAALEDVEPAVNAAAETSLAGLGEAAAPALVDGLDTPSERLGARVASLIARLGRGPQLLAEALSFTSVDVRIHAASGLAALGNPRARVALSALAATPTSRNARLRAAVAKALAAIDPRPDLAPPPITVTNFDTRQLTEAELAAAKAALSALGVFGLAAHLNDGRLAVRANVAAALGTLASTDAAAPLAVALRDSAPEVRLAAARSLERLGDAAVAAAADDLVRALRDDGLATIIAGMLRSRATGAIDAALARGLDTTDAPHAHRICELITVRPGGLALLCDAFARAPCQINAARGLAMLGAERLGAGRAVLEAARGDLSPSTRELAAATLRTIDGAPAVPTPPAVAGFETTLLPATAFTGGLTVRQLLPFLQDGRPIVRANAATALGTVGASADLALTIGALLRDDDPQVRVAAAQAIDKLGDDVVIATASHLVAALCGPVAVHAACKAVLAPRGAKVEAALVAGLDTSDETHGMRVAELICALPNAPQLLFAAFDGEAQNVQLNAALGIGLLGAKRAGAAGRARLRSGLTGPITRRHHAVVKALALLGPE